jgi:hypothetical protein
MNYHSIRCDPKHSTNEAHWTAPAHRRESLRGWMEPLLLAGGGEWTPSGGPALEWRFVELTTRLIEESPCSYLAVANGLQVVRALLRRESWRMESRRDRSCGVSLRRASPGNGVPSPMALELGVELAPGGARLAGRAGS